MKKFLLSFLCFLLAIGGGYAEEATLSFANKAQRTSFSETQQVWEQNDITFTNNRSASTNDVADYAKPVRLYAGSNIVVECSLGNITKIVFDCNSSSYATALKNSIGTTATTSVSSDKVTVTLDGSSNSFTVASLSKQVRLDALTVTYTASSSGEVSKPVTPALTAGGNFVGSMEVEISCATEGAEIFYTIDGTDPTEDSEAYIKPLEITETTTVKAIAVNDAGSSNVATAVYTRVAATPEISFNEATFEESVEVTITAAEGTTAYYTLNGKTPDNNSEECPETLTLKADATLQVIAYDKDGYESPIVKQVFKQTVSSVGGASTGTATLVTDVTNLNEGDQVVIVASGSDVALSTTQNSNNRGQVTITKDGNDVVLNENVQVLTLSKINSWFEFYTGKGYLYAASSSNNYLKTQTKNNDNGRWTIEISDSGVATIVAQGTNTRKVLRYNQLSALFSCYAEDKASGQQDVSLYKVNLSSVSDYVLNVTPAGWATLYLGYNVVIPEDVTCYVASEINGESVILEEVTAGVLPANTAVIVNAAEGEYTFEVTDATATIESIMAGTTKNEYVDKDAYVLGMADDEVGLYKAEKKGGVFLNNANKAYLPASPQTQNAKALKFNFDTTGVEGVKVETAGKKVIYDLSGRRVNEMAQPGIYIVNGKKVMVK